ncbi:MULTISPECIES: 30S ribosome-binding factor RbfA [Weeksella]|uniref:Ribosome-binding factor A n=1 Tax=Weeksella virosa (strain ATCC 43766 / DSM 16922 / JCM 21250 / CCUG 30538 / CDC 9751 / IAM 14551 / NBRC 16016 / NCTC 11634 / CL345/78) TaxID=865938 RepID=F0P135_WEEVC|nr:MULTISPECIES: 30S ribosome-binding factor RbfA [Weeksella]ADX68619.1 Ribosome-binding factor A [Weeksella virosa DSM 16922]MDK7375848.1 30S ribosome-binding factor RbfA [Weeksella virosa]MDK7676271.1 30S ribosome-binding factor RbfA [Weeksella virosa]OFM82346.1 ribosome-binding factor A [Weeksella sp. HMSC059D05]SUP54960.1 Ribosome-binding factor A [Weeksella virosa]
MDSNRQQKVGKLFQEELAEAFRKWASELFPGNLVSVTEVKVTPDLSIAKVFISIFPNDKKDEILQEINTQAPYFRGILSKGAAKNMRLTPELIFRLDPTLDEMDKIDRALSGKGNNPIL